MNDIEKYLRDHATEMDTATPAEGHEERFLARLDVTPALGGSPVKPANDGRARLASLFRAAWIPASACAALVLALVLVIRPGDPFRHVGDDPKAIYLAYMDEVSRIYREAPACDCADRDAAIRSITEEEEPYFEQLPEEYTLRKRARMLKTYYTELLSLAQEINDKY